MSTESLLLILVAGQALLLAAVLFRRPPPEPALDRALAALERQGERLGAVAESVRDLPARVEGQLAPAVGALTAQQVRALSRLQERLSARLDEEARRTRDLLDRKLREVADENARHLAAIERAVHETLQDTIERRMADSFARVLDQFTAIQAMMAQVQSVASQVGDLRRVFSNVKARGGWGETQLRALLDDFLPPGAYLAHARMREDSLDAVEFAILLPGPEPRALLPLDAKFPAEDWERLLAAQEAGDGAAEAQARRGVEQRLREEARKIAAKYICPPRSTDFAVMYLPSEGLYAEAARIPGLLDQLARERVFVAGPALLPALLRTVQIGHVSFALSENASGVRDLLAATRDEMGRMEGLLAALSRQMGQMQGTIGKAQTRTRAIARKLRGVETLPPGEVAALLEGAEADEEEGEVAR